MKETKTSKESWTEIGNLLKSKGKDDLAEFAFEQVRAIEQKLKQGRKLTVNQLDNIKIGKIVLDRIGNGKYTVQEVIHQLLNDTEYYDLTESRMSAILTQLVDEKKLFRSVMRRKAYYSKYI